MMHKYFISFYISDKGSMSLDSGNFSNTVISLENITDMDNIKYIEKEIEDTFKEKGFKVDVIILNWRRMEDPD